MITTLQARPDAPSQFELIEDGKPSGLTIPAAWLGYVKRNKAGSIISSIVPGAIMGASDAPSLG